MEESLEIGLTEFFPNKVVRVVIVTNLKNRAGLVIGLLGAAVVATGFVVEPGAPAAFGNGCFVHPYHDGSPDWDHKEATEYVRSCDWGTSPTGNCGEVHRERYPDLDGGPTDKAYNYYCVHPGGTFVDPTRRARAPEPLDWIGGRKRALASPSAGRGARSAPSAAWRGGLRELPRGGTGGEDDVSGRLKKNSKKTSDRKLRSGRQDEVEDDPSGRSERTTKQMANVGTASRGRSVYIDGESPFQVLCAVTALARAMDQAYSCSGSHDSIAVVAGWRAAWFQGRSEPSYVDLTSASRADNLPEEFEGDWDALTPALRVLTGDEHASLGTAEWKPTRPITTARVMSALLAANVQDVPAGFDWRTWSPDDSQG